MRVQHMDRLPHAEEAPSSDVSIAANWRRLEWGGASKPSAQQVGESGSWNPLAVINLAKLRRHRKAHPLLVSRSFTWPSFPDRREENLLSILSPAFT